MKACWHCKNDNICVIANKLREIAIPLANMYTSDDPSESGYEAMSILMAKNCNRFEECEG